MKVEYSESGTLDLAVRILTVHLSSLEHFSSLETCLGGFTLELYFKARYSPQVSNTDGGTQHCASGNNLALGNRTRPR